MSTLARYKTPEIQATALAALVAGQLAGALKSRGRATFSVGGGRTPGAFLTALSKAQINWSVVDVVLTDERFVDETSTRSNTRLLRETLFQNRATSAHLIPICENAGTPEAAVANFSAGVAAVLPLDVCVLGMGTDGHIASLFPDADRLNAALDLQSTQPLIAIQAPDAEEPRITLSAHALCNSRHLHLLITGADKLGVLEQAEKTGPVKEAPVRAVLGHPDLTIHYADKGDPT